MLYFSRWKAAAILLTTFLVCACAVPNFFPEKTVQSWPTWAQRHLVLGLDLQGGSHILLEVDTNAVRKEKVETLRDDVRRVVRENRLGSPAAATIRGNTVEFRVREGVDPQLALTKLRELSQPLGGILSATGQRSVDVVDAGNGLIRLTPTEPAIVERIRQSVEQSIQIVERRVNELGTVEPSIQRQGVDRILVQVPGLQDPSRLKELLGKTAKLDLPAGRSDHADRAGAAGQRAAGFRAAQEHQGREQPALRDREARRRLGRGPHRRAARLRPAQRRADRHLPLQQQRRAPLRPGDAGERRQAVRHRARQRGDLGAGDPRADPRRLGPDFRQLHRAGARTTSPSCCAPARCRRR